MIIAVSSLSAALSYQENKKKTFAIQIARRKHSNRPIVNLMVQLTYKASIIGEALISSL